MTSWARRLASLDLLSKKGRGNATASSSAAANKKSGSRSAHSGRHFLAEKYAGDDSIVMSGSCGGSGLGRAEVASEEDEGAADVEDAVYDHSDNLARCCREFYERRILRAAEERLKPAARSASSSDLKSLTTASACSSGYFSLNTADGPASSTAVTGGAAVPDDIKSMVDSAAGLQPKLEYLKQELLGLMDQDNELFKQLLMLNDAVEEMKAASSTTAAPFAISRSIAEHPEDEDEDDSDDGQPLSFDPSDATCSSPLKRSSRTFTTSPIQQVTESAPHQPPPAFNLSLPVSHFQQSQQPPQIQQQQQLTALNPLPVDEPIAPPDSFSVDEDVEDDDEEDLINELLDEALNLSCSSSDASSPRSTRSSHSGSAPAEAQVAPETPILPKLVNRVKCGKSSSLDRGECGGGYVEGLITMGSGPPSTVLRTQSVLLRSGFQRQRVSFPATGRNRRKNSPPVKRELPAPLPPPPLPPGAHVRTLPSSVKKKPMKETFAGADGRRILPVPPQAMPPPPLPAAAEATAKEWRHVKQSSIDSGIIQSISSSSSSSSSSPSQSGSDSASEANSDMAM